MGHGIEQNRSEPVTFAGSFAFGQLLNCIRPFDRDGNQTTDGFEAFAREIAAVYGEGAHGSYSHPQGDVANPALAVEHWFPAIADCLQLVGRKQASALAVKKIRVLFSFDEDCGSADSEGVDNALRNEIRQFKCVFCQP